MQAQPVVSSLQVASSPYVLEATFDQPVGTVWEAITRKQLIDQYYFLPIGADVTQVGAEVSYGTPAEKLITGVVLALEPQRLLRHSFRFAQESDTADTVVTYTLTGSAAGTRLRIEHAGYAAGSQGYADIAGGWPVILEQLKALLAREDKR